MNALVQIIHKRTHKHTHTYTQTRPARTQTQIHTSCIPCDVVLINFIIFYNFMSLLACGCDDNLHTAHLNTLTQCVYTRRGNTHAHARTKMVYLFYHTAGGTTYHNETHTHSRFALNLTASSGFPL